MPVAAAAPEIVAVIPALDAARTIGPVIAGARRHLPRVLVVDDGSADDTGERAAAAGAALLRHPATLGKGAALATAFAWLLPGGPGALAGIPCDGVLTLDADGQHDPGDIPLFRDLFAAARPAIIVGSRARHFDAMWGPRRVMNRFSSAALHFFSGASLPDSQSGFRLYDVRFLMRAVPPGPPASPVPAALGRRYEAEMQLLMRAARMGLPIASVPIRLTVADGRATSHYRALRDTFRIVGAVLRERTRDRRS
jgi:glycosyltransferase involved in cell wall biosynthesis